MKILLPCNSPELSESCSSTATFYLWVPVTVLPTWTPCLPAAKLQQAHYPCQETSTPAPFTVNESNECADFKSESVEGNMFAKNAITYVSGYVVRKCQKKHKCPTCAEALTSNDLDSPDKLLSEFKAYDNSKPFGGLTVPDERLVRYIHSAEQIFVDTFPNVISKQGIGKHLMSMLPKFKLQECPQFPSQYMLELFVRMRLYYVLKFGNRDLAQPKQKGEKDRKYFKVSHL